MSGRTRPTSGILQVPVMMDIQSLTHQDFTGLTKEQKKKAIEQLKLVMKMVDPKGKVPMGSDIAYIPEKKIACIDLTSFYEDDEHPETEADLCDFVDMFTDGYTSDEHGNIETSEEDEILATGDYEDDDDVQRKYDIDRCLECARHNVQKLHDMIEAVERAKAQGATKFAAIDFNDYDGDCDDDD
ncbi:MAG: hypothetical protein IIZ78_08580 [Clostridiales bacterium]|nr:hypothetical protein [Clostridiales bacterium]